MVSQLLGGIGLFLLGVFLMTDGLKTAAGSALRRLLVRFTGRPASAFVSGTGITVLAQSSSATTLATIGFVSAGILTFSQAIGVVMGACFGTTSTGWLVALVGLQFGIGKLAFPLVGLGALVRLVSHGRTAAIALAVAGFGLMFVGIDILQAGMVSLSNSFSPSDLPQGTLVGRALLVGIGIVLTVVTQSSAAAVATTLAAYHAGMIGLEQGASLIIGASIGTTSTSALAAIGATTPAKRTALAHILFSVAAGGLAFVILPLFVWGVKATERRLGFEIGAVVLAAFHSGFTLLAALLVLPGVKRFGSLVERLVPDRGPTLTRHLDASLVEVPEVALEAARRSLMDIATEIFAQIKERLEGAPPANLDRTEAVRAALKETRRFLGTIASPAGQPEQLNVRLSIVHALDHLNQLAGVVTNGIKPSRLMGNERLQSSKGVVQEMIATAKSALQRSPAAGELEALQRMSRDLAERRRTERGVVLEESARGSVPPGRALHTLDGLRWLDAIGYHTWRALNHLCADNAEADESQAMEHEHGQYACD